MAFHVMEYQRLGVMSAASSSSETPSFDRFLAFECLYSLWAQSLLGSINTEISLRRERSKRAAVSSPPGVPLLWKLQERS